MSVDLFSRVAVVLLRPKSPGNVGSVARAMKNMGFRRLIVAAPMVYDDPSHFDVEARRMAWQASDLLDARQLAPDLDSALAPFALVAGTTASPARGARVLPPRELAGFIAAGLRESPTASAALLFGQEDIGLTREAQARCHRIGAIDTSCLYPSLNLAQAALLFLYEMRLAILGPAPADSARGPAGPPPRHEDLEAFYVRLETALETIGFFQGTARAHMMREMRTIFNRSIMTGRELAILEGVVHQVLWAASRRG